MYRQYWRLLRLDRLAYIGLQPLECVLKSLRRVLSQAKPQKMAESRHQGPIVSPLAMSCLTSIMKRQLSLTHLPQQSTLFRRDRRASTPSGSKSAVAKKLDLIKLQMSSIEKSFKAWKESNEAIARRRSRPRQDPEEPRQDPEEPRPDLNGFAALRPTEVFIFTCSIS